MVRQIREFLDLEENYQSKCLRLTVVGSMEAKR